MRSEVLPTYANTHSSGSGCGVQTSHFFAEAREILLDEVGGTSDDVVLFAGDGCTGAVAKIVHLLGIRATDAKTTRYNPMVTTSFAFTEIVGN